MKNQVLQEASQQEPTSQATKIEIIEIKSFCIKVTRLQSTFSESWKDGREKGDGLNKKKSSFDLWMVALGSIKQSNVSFWHKDP